MKTIILIAFVCSLCSGCRQVEHRFKVGDIVEMKLDGRTAEVTSLNKIYPVVWVRISTPAGYESMRVNEDSLRPVTRKATP